MSCSMEMSTRFQCATGEWRRGKRLGVVQLYVLGAAGRRRVTRAHSILGMRCTKLSATFVKHRWQPRINQPPPPSSALPHLPLRCGKHYAYALGRDEDGVYYYVDRAIDDEGGPRLFVGTKGNVEQKQLLDSTIDADGGVLTTDGARLSIGLEGGQVSQMRWSLDEVRVDLTPLDLWQNRSLIYAGLGAYGERLGTPCDDL